MQGPSLALSPFDAGSGGSLQSRGVFAIFRLNYKQGSNMVKNAPTRETPSLVIGRGKTKLRSISAQSCLIAIKLAQNFPALSQGHTGHTVNLAPQSLICSHQPDVPVTSALLDLCLAAADT